MCFFFKQKTAYEMRISDWSSDVCSSDLLTRSALLLAGRLVLTALVAHLALPVFLLLLASTLAGAVAALLVATLIAALIVLGGHVSLLFTFLGAEDRTRVVKGNSWSLRIVLGGRCILKQTGPQNARETRVHL